MSLTFVVVLAAMGVWSFYGNVLNPHGSGVSMAGMVMPEDGGSPEPDSPSSFGTTESQGGPAAGSSGDEDVIPDSLGGWPLAELAVGDEARAQVEQLHGKGLGAGLESAWVAHYGASAGSGRPAATVWLTRAVEAADSLVLYERMTDRIAEGTSPFTGLRPIGVDGVEGYALDGMGQTHFYFLMATDLYWLAVDPAAAEAVLAELLASARQAAPAG